jgi:F-type H+-transporting ATPase subunit b
MRSARTLAFRSALALAIAAPSIAFAATQEPAPQEPSVERAKNEGDTRAEAKEEEGEGPKPINFFDLHNKEQPPYAAALFNFGLLMVLYYSLGKKPVKQALKNRRAEVAKEIEEAQRMKHEAEERAKRYQVQLGRLGEELASTKKALEEAGKTERERIVKEAEEKAARMQKEAAFLLEQEAKQMRQDLTRETVDLAIASAAELLQKQVTGDDQVRIAEEFLLSLEGRGKDARP